MKISLLLILVVLTFQIAFAQERSFQKGHTHDILAVRFSPDDQKLVSYSWGDGWLCYWDVTQRQLVWKAKTGFIQRAEERSNLEAFGWNADQTLLYTKSENGTFQTWNANTGTILAVSETNPDPKAFQQPTSWITVIKQSGHFLLTNQKTGLESTIQAFSRTGSVFDVSHDGTLLAEGGSWGNAAIRVTSIVHPDQHFDLTGGKVLPLMQTELEKKALDAKAIRLAQLEAERSLRNKQGEVDAKIHQKKVFISFDHFGDMTDPGELRMTESSKPKMSQTQKSRETATAIWARLHNTSPFPIIIPTQSLYLPEKDCFFTFKDGTHLSGLCDQREISVWFGLKDKRGKWIPYGFDFGSSAILLPNTSVLFSIPTEILKNENRIQFSYTFQNTTGEHTVTDYGPEQNLTFGMADTILK